MGLTIITPAIDYPVSRSDAKRQCRVHSSDSSFDIELDGYIAAATRHVENVTQMALEPTGYRLTIDAFSGNIKLPIGPVISIDSVEYYSSGELTAIEDEDFTLHQISEGLAEIIPVSSWPTADVGLDMVVVEFTAGVAGETDSYIHVSAVEDALKQAILLLVGHWWRNRSAVEAMTSGDMITVPLAFDALIAPYKRVVLA